MLKVRKTFHVLKLHETPESLGEDPSQNTRRDGHTIQKNPTNLLDRSGQISVLFSDFARPLDGRLSR